LFELACYRQSSNYLLAFFGAFGYIRRSSTVFRALCAEVASATSAFRLRYRHAGRRHRPADFEGLRTIPAHRKGSSQADLDFFAALGRGVPVSVACKVAGCSRQALYRRRVTDHTFDRKWREAEAAAREEKERARTRKRPGYTLAVFAPRGRGRRKAMSDGLLLARLKAVRPSYRYCGPRGSAKADSEVGHPSPVPLVNLRGAETSGFLLFSTRLNPCTARTVVAHLLA
jgi:hypothetical protein